MQVSDFPRLFFAIRFDKTRESCKPRSNMSGDNSSPVFFTPPRAPQKRTGPQNIFRVSGRMIYLDGRRTPVVIYMEIPSSVEHENVRLRARFVFPRSRTLFNAINQDGCGG